MSTMVMCADQTTPAGMFQRCPSPPQLNYPFNSFPYGAPGAQHPQDYNQFQIPEPGVQHAWYNAMYGPRTDEWAYGPGPTGPTPGVMTSTTTAMGVGGYPYRSMGLDYSQPGNGQMGSSESPADTSSSSSSSGSPSNKQLRPPYDWMKKATYQSAPTSGK